MIFHKKVLAQAVESVALAKRDTLKSSDPLVAQRHSATSALASVVLEFCMVCVVAAFKDYTCRGGRIESWGYCLVASIASIVSRIPPNSQLSPSSLLQRRDI